MTNLPEDEHASRESASASGQAAPVFEAAALDEMRAMLSEEKFNELLDSLQTEIRTKSAQIRARLRAGRERDLKRYAHDLKGMSAYFGLRALNQAARDLEAAGVDEDGARLKLAADELLAASEAALKALAANRPQPLDQPRERRDL